MSPPKKISRSIKVTYSGFSPLENERLELKSWGLVQMIVQISDGSTVTSHGVYTVHKHNKFRIKKGINFGGYSQPQPNPLHRK